MLTMGNKENLKKTTLHLKQLEKEEQIKPKFSRRKEIFEEIRIRNFPK